MAKLIKRTIIIMLVFFLLLGLAAGAGYWRLSTITIDPAAVKMDSPQVTVETDKFKMDLPGYFFEQVIRVGSLQWPDSRIVFHERLFAAQAEADRSFAQQARIHSPQRIREDLSERLGRPAVLYSGFGSSQLCLFNERSLKPDAVVCPQFSLIVQYPKGYLTFNQIAGRDYTPVEMADAGRRETYFEEKKANFIQQIQEFTAAYVWLEEAAPPPEAPGCSTGPGFIARTGAENFIYTFHMGSFASPSRNLLLTISSDRVTPWVSTPPPYHDKFRHIRTFLLDYGMFTAYNYYPRAAGGADGFEYLSIYPYFFEEPVQFLVTWRETVKSDRPEKFNLEIGLSNDVNKTFTEDELPEIMGLWQSILSTLQIKPAPEAARETAGN